jgi:hypothetical protein
LPIGPGGFSKTLISDPAISFITRMVYPGSVNFNGKRGEKK